MAVYKCFTCSCNYPFDNKEGLSTSPLVGIDGNRMRIGCSTFNGKTTSAYWLLDLLSQPAFKMNVEGYTLEGTPELPRCPGCKKLFMSPRLPHFLMCGHLICNGCKANNQEKKCYTCAALYGDDDNPECTILIDFHKQLEKEQPDLIASLTAKEEAEKIEEEEEERIRKEAEAAAEAEKTRAAAVKACAGCKLSAPISQLIHCNNCAVSVCGGCFVKGHQGHKIVSLLETELCSLKETTSTAVIGTIEGYGENFQHLHSSIQKGIAALAKTGGAKCEEVAKQDSYENGMAIVARMKKLSTDFERKCQDYMPIVRKFNDELIDLREQIEKAGQETEPTAC